MTRSRAIPQEEDLEKKLGHRFRQRDLLRRALTHSSYANEVLGGGTDNEPLEFLGDALLGCLISVRLFQAFPEKDEGDLSRFKASLVSASLLSDAFEALVAAIYLDGGFEAARAFLERQFEADFSALTGAGLPRERDAKTSLQELLQSRGRPTPRYQILKESGPAHRRNFLVGLVLEGKAVAFGRGRTRKAAEQAAARKVLQSLRSGS